MKDLIQTLWSALLVCSLPTRNELLAIEMY